MIVYKIEPQSQYDILYKYNSIDDTLHINNQIEYTLNSGFSEAGYIRDTYFADMERLEAGTTTDLSIINADKYLGLIGLDTAITPDNKENLWVS